MPNLSFNDSVYIGTPDGSIGISMNDQNSLITYNGGIVNNGGYIYPIRNVLAFAAYTASSSDFILLVNSSDTMGTAKITYLGNQSDGKILHIRRVDSAASVYTIQASGSDVIRLGVTSSVTSFTMTVNTSYTLAYNSGIWWLIRNGGNVVYNPPGGGPPPT